MYIRNSCASSITDVLGSLPISRLLIGRQSIFTKILPIFFAFSSGVLLTLAFPNFNLGFLAWIALVPFFIAITGKNVICASAFSFLMGGTFFAGVFYWITGVRGFTWYDFLLAGVYLASFVALFGVALSVISKTTRWPLALTAPVLWVTIEYVRSHFGLIVLPWALLGHSQYLNLPIIQIAALTGVYGISFLVVMVNAVIAETICYLKKRNQKTREQSPARARSVFVVSLSALIVVFLSMAYGHFMLSRSTTTQTTLDITVIQGNLPQAIRFRPDFRFRNVQNHLRLTEASLRSFHPKLIIWPEVAAQGSFRQDLYLARTISDFARRSDAHFLIGSAERPKYGQVRDARNKSFNSAFLLSRDGRIVGQYNKMHLLPFSEYLPHDDIIPWPARYKSQTAHFMPGTEHTIFSLDSYRFGVTICWEAIFPDFFRRFVRQGTDFMVNITNESLFGESEAPYQFLSMIVFRAVENHISIARSAYTGISGFIDPNGRIIGTVNTNNKVIFVEGFLSRPIPLSRQPTFYTNFGDVFAFTCMAIATVGLLVSIGRLSLFQRRYKLYYE